MTKAKRRSRYYAGCLLCPTRFKSEEEAKEHFHEKFHGWSRDPKNYRRSQEGRKA